jgi:hypothetical protein
MFDATFPLLLSTNHVSMHFIVLAVYKDLDMEFMFWVDLLTILQIS